MPKGRFAEDHTGKVFSRLTVLSMHDNIRHQPRWLCRCECGKQVVVHAHHLKAGNVRSCGCLLADITKARCVTHGESGGGIKSQQTPEYRAWSRMKERVSEVPSKYNKVYSDRGIAVCERWLSYQNFLEDMGRMPSPGLQLDRIDNDKGYEPGNVRWATFLQQQRNKRRNIRLTIDGETLYLTEWAEELGIKAHTIHSRLRNGWDPKRAVFQPVRKRASKKES